MKTLVAISGGVDSSVAAALLLEQGHQIGGVYLRHGVEQLLPDGVTAGGCGNPKDEQDARKTAQMLGIPFYVVDASEKFHLITHNFVSEYLSCRTPNPCVMCNRLIKFGLLYDFALQQGYDHLATGHYARVMPVGPAQSELNLTGSNLSESNLTESNQKSSIKTMEYGIFQAADSNKDQSYVLFGIPRQRIANLVFPLGEYTKPQIRALAAARNFPAAAKKDSQEICFIPDNNHARFICPYKKDEQGNPLDTSGNIVTVEGKVVGTHDGIERFTIGQRKGLGVAMNSRYFVVELRPQTHEVVLGTHEQLGRSSFTVSNANWLTCVPEYFCSQIKIRYKFSPAPATIHLLDNNRFSVETDAPVYGVAPGQACVCYDGERVLGGGWID